MTLTVKTHPAVLQAHTHIPKYVSVISQRLKQLIKMVCMSLVMLCGRNFIVSIKNYFHLA